MGLGTALGAVLGVGGIASNLLTNSANSELNERNYRLALRQQEFAENSFREQMKYNSPVTQMSLQRAAGINPSLQNMAGSVSTAGNGSTPSNLPMQPLDSNALNGLASNMALLDTQKENVESNTQKNVADAESAVEQTRTNILHRLAQLHKLTSEKEATDAQKELYNQQIAYEKKKLNFVDEQLEWQNQNLRFEAESKMYDNKIKEIQQRYLPMLNDMQIKQIFSSMALNYATADKEQKTAKFITQETMSELMRTGILANQFDVSSADATMGKTFNDGMKNNKYFRVIQTTLQKVLFPMLTNMPSLFLPIK